MASEALIEAVMNEFRHIPKAARDNVLTALLAHEVSKNVEGVTVVMDPDFAKRLQPILKDETTRSALKEALLRLSKEDKKPSGWKKFFGLGG